MNLNSTYHPIGWSRSLRFVKLRLRNMPVIQENVVDTEDLVLVPPGEYVLKHESHAVLHRFDWKLCMAFRIVDGQEHSGKRLFRYYNISYLLRPNGKKIIQAGWHSDFMREFVGIFDEKPRRVDEIPLTRFNGRSFIGDVKTVVKNSKGRTIHELVRYSRVAELLRLAD